jgi:Glycosyltransferase family 87
MRPAEAFRASGPRDNRPMAERVRRVGLGTVLVCLVGTLLLGLVEKSQPSFHGLHLPTSACATGAWTGQQYTRLCYSDIVPLYGTEHLQGGRFPYLDPCPEVEGQNCDEYPVLTMLTMYLAARPVDNFGGFLFSNALLLSIAAGVAAVSLYMVAGRRALWFALAPTLLVYGFMNWDLIAVAFAAAGTTAFLKRRDTAAGVLLGLGAAAKLYPALLVIPFALERFRERKPDPAIHLVWAAAGTWIVVNLPFALFGFHDWTEFFRFNAHRGADFDSLWFIACRQLHSPCLSGSTLNNAWILIFLGAAGLVTLVRWLSDRQFPLWTLGLPFVILFLLVNKVYSPQYGLWLLPLFVVCLPGLRPRTALGLFVAFELADVAVFVTRFTWFGTLDPYNKGGAPHWAFELSVAVRAAVLLAVLVAYLLQRRPLELEGGEPAEASGAPAEASEPPAEVPATEAGGAS